MKTHCKHGHAFDEANTYRRPDGSVACRECRKQRMRAYRVDNPTPFQLAQRALRETASSWGHDIRNPRRVAGMLLWKAAKRLDARCA